MYKDILAVLTASEGEDGAIAAARALADAGGGAPTALLLEAEPDPPYAADALLISSAWAEVLESAHKDFAAAETKLRARLARETRPWTVRTGRTLAGLLSERAGVEARYADLVVMTRPGGRERMGVLEGVLFGSGRPVLVVPPDWKGAAIGRKVVIGWNAKREAARALADARPLIERADAAFVVTVDAEPDTFGHGQAPGADVAAHLARCGLKVEVRNVDGMGRVESAALLDECRAVGADLLVIGGYGHARVQEMVFGGVTRDLIRAAPLPVLLSH